MYEFLQMKQKTKERNQSARQLRNVHNASFSNLVCTFGYKVTDKVWLVTKGSRLTISFTFIIELIASLILRKRNVGLLSAWVYRCSNDCRVYEKLLLWRE